MKIEAIYSGCQEGADQGGLRAAKRLGIKTGGLVPKNCRTEQGNKPELIKEYGLKETKESNYHKRTYLNVRDSDATIIFCSNPGSFGTQCTLKAIKFYKKPHLLLLLKDLTNKEEMVKSWLESYNVKILNIAGNRESVSPGIGQLVEDFLVKVLQLRK